MIKKEQILNELYVYIFCPIKRKWDLLYKRWLDKNYGKVMDRQPFTAKDVEINKTKNK
ncbi:MAG TPA: hypothetical protein PKD00_03100 [Burkholderiales bacterium]|nr:hypothetical protein [Burkholderiales bacterium]